MVEMGTGKKVKSLSGHYGTVHCLSVHPYEQVCVRPSSHLYTIRKCYSIGASEGEFYIDGFVLLKFIEPVRSALNEFKQYKTSYVELAFTRPML